MKKLFTPLALFAFSFLFLVTGCVKDECKSTYKIYIPVYKTLTQVRASIKSETARPLRETGKVYTYGNYVFVNEPEKGIHVINNSNPAAPQNISFINIPGNVDLSIRNGYLYADSYSDLVVLDINNPADAKTKKFIGQAFPDRTLYFSTSTNPDSIQVIVDYIEKDTVVNCETYSYWVGRPSFDQLGGVGAVFSSAAPKTGQGGSTARFTIVNDYLYTVSTTDLTTFDISNAVDPQTKSNTHLGWNIETIYPFTDKLFIGSRTGVFIFSIANPASPSMLGQFSHVSACDPVIADGQYAYVTLRSGTSCQNFTNQMEVLSIANISSPTLLKVYPMTNPSGLAKDGNLLFICDGASGLKVMNAADPVNITPIKTISSLQPADVILQNKNALVIAKDGLYQYDYTDQNNIRLISKLPISK